MNKSPSAKKKILVVVDNATRDLLPSRLIEKELLDRGMEVAVCSKRDIKFAFAKLKPDACLLPRGDWPITQDLARFSRVYIIPSEGGRLTPETMLSVFLGRLHGTKRLDQHLNEIHDFSYIRRVYLWGSETHGYLARSGHFKPEQLLVCGNPRLDIYRSRASHHAPPAAPTGPMTIGVAFSAKSTSIYEGRIKYAELLFNTDENSFLPLVPPGKHWEDYAWRDLAMLRKMMWLIKRIIKETPHRVILRVGPLENFDDYVFLQKKYPDRITIQHRDEQLIDFLEKSQLLLTCWSTTGIEGLLINLPVIGIPFLIDQEHLLAHVDPKANGFDTILRCYHTPTHENEVMDLILKRERGALKSTPNTEFFDDFIRRVYHWPSEQSATKNVVDDLLKDLEDFSYRPKPQFNPPSLKFPGPVEILARIPILRQITFTLLQTLKAIRNLQIDLSSGGYTSNRNFYSTRNREVQKLVEKTFL